MIAAILRVDGTGLEPSLVAQMLGAGLPFTPDAEGIWVEGEVGLGDARLWLTDESGSNRLPMRDERRELVLAWDGRLDNREDLLASFGSSRSKVVLTDEALVLEAYGKWGVTCVDRLLGDFAFVLWDGRARRMLAARDHMGVRPLHYAFDGRSVVVASRIGQVFEGARLPRSLNESMIADFLSMNLNSPDETLFRSVLRVPAAHVLLHDRGSRAPRIRRYWSVRAHPPIRHRSDDDYVDHFREIAQRVVRSRLRSLHPVGVMLSGGLDSSTVAFMASELINGAQSSNGRLATFTAVFDQFRDADERHYVDRMVARCGLESHYVLADGMWTLKDGTPRVGSWDEPFEGTYDGVIEGLLDRAEKEGVRVLLTGFGGDMLFSGSLYYLHDLALDLRWARLMGELRCWPLSKWPWLMQHYVLAPLAGRPPKHEVSYQVPEWVRPEFAARIEVERRLHEAHPPRRFSRPSQQFDFEAIAYVAFSTKLLWLQADGIRRGIDLRHPLFDVRLIDFFMRIPSSQKIRNGFSKALIRSAMKESLPPIIIKRPLADNGGDFTKVLDRGLRERERHRWETCFAGNFRLGELGYVDPVSLRHTFARYVEGEDELRWELALVFRLEQWLRHQDGEHI